MLDVGAQVEKYEVLEHLGGGGFADVYRVRHIHLGTAHALKVLKAEHVENESIRLRFLDEARVQAQLVHPNIARVTDIIVKQGVAGLVMEYLEGRSLADFIEERGGPATAEEILAITLPVLDGLHFAHERGVIHRDVKPDNIFLAVHDAGQQVAKVLDFGIAKVRGELRQEGRRKSTVATGMGTEGYASPEQLRNAADVDRRADVFSVGVTLYELATGRLPFQRDSEVDSMMALMNGDLEIPSDLRRRLPEVAAVIEKALQNDRENRFKDSKAMGAALRGHPGDRQAHREAGPGGQEAAEHQAMEAHEAAKRLAAERKAEAVLRVKAKEALEEEQRLAEQLRRRADDARNAATLRLLVEEENRRAVTERHKVEEEDRRKRVLEARSRQALEERRLRLEMLDAETTKRRASSQRRYLLFIAMVAVLGILSVFLLPKLLMVL